MSTETLAAPFAKIERAETQIAELSERIREHFSACTIKIVSRIDTVADEEIWSFKVTKPLSSDIAVRVGEILHNLRSALDQAVTEIASRADGGGEYGTNFPFGSSEADFTTSLG